VHTRELYTHSDYALNTQRLHTPPSNSSYSSHTDYCISQLYLHRPRNETRVRDVSYSHRYRVLTHSITHVVFAVPAAGAPDDTPINDSS